MFLNVCDIFSDSEVALNSAQFVCDLFTAVSVESPRQDTESELK